MAAASSSIQPPPYIDLTTSAPTEHHSIEQQTPRAPFYNLPDGNSSIDRRRSTIDLPLTLQRIVHRDKAESPPLRDVDVVDQTSTASAGLTGATRSRANSAAPRSPTKPIFHTRRQSQSKFPVVDISVSELRPSSPIKTPTNLPNDARPAHLKRSPASHSSYGVETSNGPPPAISTQRTLTEDLLWKPTIADVLDLEVRLPSPPSITLSPLLTTDIVLDSPHASSSPESYETGNRSPVSSHLMDSPKIDSHTVESYDEDPDQTLRAMDAATDEESKKSSSGSREDLFLNIAKAEEDEISRGQRRRSRIGTSLLSPRFSTDGPKSKTRLSLNNITPSSASAHPLEDSSRLRYFSASQKPSISVPRGVVGVDQRQGSPESVQGYRRRRYSNADTNSRYGGANIAAQRSNRLVSGSVIGPFNGRHGDSEKTRIDGTESTISTTAPSTVWDELDDLKSRIRKLELTGKLPPSSAAAMNSTMNERPQTATTTVTTMSSSPKHSRKKDSPVETTVGGVSSNVHPLLHEALSNARSTVSSDVYQKLEAAATDALQLASLMSGGTAQGTATSVVGGGSSVERQGRRRVDSLCRGLTELAIALSAQAPRPGTANARPSSRDAASSTGADASLRYRRSSQDPEERGQPTPRVHSRLDTRRSSLLTGSQLNSPRYASPESAINGSAGTSSSQTPRGVNGRLNRHSLTLRNRRNLGYGDGANEDAEDDNPAPRPVSRAMTEAATPSSYRYSPKDRSSFSREYTSQHPLPPRNTESSPQSPSVVSSTFPPRRAYISTSSALGSSPITPANTTPSGLRRYGTATSTISPSNSSRAAVSTSTKFASASTPTALPEIRPEDDTLSTISSVNNRGASIRQRLGAASSRIGSSVGSRLRAAAKEEKERRNNRLSEGIESGGSDQQTQNTES